MQPQAIFFSLLKIGFRWDKAHGEKLVQKVNPSLRAELISHTYWASGSRNLESAVELSKTYF